MSSVEELLESIKSPAIIDDSSFDVVQQREIVNLLNSLTDSFKTTISDYDKYNRSERNKAILDSDSGFSELSTDARAVLDNEENADWLSQVVRGTGGKTIKHQLEYGLENGDKTLLKELIGKEDISSFASKKRASDEIATKEKGQALVDQKRLAALNKKVGDDGIRSLSEAEFKELSLLQLAEDS